MPGENRLTLAVAGAGKTQNIVDTCAAAKPSERILILTYTTANQDELRHRLASDAGHHHQVEVSGWFSFLINHFARPYTPFLYRGQTVRRLDTVSGYQRGVSNGARSRYFTADGDLRKTHLPQYATRLNEASHGHPLRRLERIYDRIFIDEAQDLCGYDLEVLELLFDSELPIYLVGDVRQATLATNNEERKHKQYKFMSVHNWFTARDAEGRLGIDHLADTWRCRPEISAFADSLFDELWGFPATTSRNLTISPHDGLFWVHSKHVNDYFDTFAPQPLRHNSLSAKAHDNLPFRNFGAVKGLTRERVLIHPTAPMKALLQKGVNLEDRAASALYVAVTRARQSVAFILDSPGRSTLPQWMPPTKGNDSTSSSFAENQGLK